MLKKVAKMTDGRIVAPCGACFTQVLWIVPFDALTRYDGYLSPVINTDAKK